MSILSQQPRWLLLSGFLVLWSWSSFRRDSSRAKALGLGVEAQLFGGGAHWEQKRQSELAPCALQCATEAGQSIGCGSSLNFICVCHSPQFMADAVNCMTTGCSPDEKATGQDSLMASCKLVGTSASIPGPPTSTDTSITSGVPPIGNPSSTSAASSEATVTVTVTSLPLSSSDSGTLATTSSSTPLTTTTSTAPTTVTSTSTTIPTPTPTPSSTRPLTTVVETSTLNIAGPAPTGAAADGSAGNGASAMEARISAVALCALLAGTVLLL
ncbi:hypothetical protein C8Q80DRAFT_1214394 [Daedaleopsis nitida]|nr:hypothetical protein C8Q80DRAFT_1214394 [Daedaleopsis nitida]